MKIEYLYKDITEVTDGAIMHGCNCSGGFGSGVAGAIKRKWPKAEQMFRMNKNPKLGDIDILIGLDPVIINAYTQEYYGYDGRKYANAEAIKIATKKAINFCIKNEIYVLYMPKIGAGLGGLNWDKDVEPLLNELDDNGITIFVCQI